MVSGTKIGAGVLGRGQKIGIFRMSWHPLASLQVSGPRPTTAADALQAWACEVLTEPNGPTVHAAV